MQITRESLESKKKSFQVQLKQLEANINAIMGAIQLVDIQIQEIDTPEPAKEEAETPKGDA